MFDTGAGKPFDPNDLRKLFAGAAKSEKVRGVVLHGPRHTEITRWADDGILLGSVQRMAGHADIKMTAPLLPRER